jgi:inhibitor of cysteine peptidase
MAKKSFINSAITILISIFILTGCTLVHKLDEQKKIQPLNNGQTEINDQENNTGSAKPLAISEKLAEQSKIKKFSNYDELKKFLEENDITSPNNYYARDMMFESMPMAKSTPDLGLSNTSNLGLASGAVSDKALPGVAPSQSGKDFSKTNNQVEGVDEADIIKSDGTYIYAVSRNNLFIIKAYPAENSEILSKIEFKSRPLDIYINGDNLVVFGQDDAFYLTDSYKRFPRHSAYVFFKVFNITDKKNPKQTRDLSFEGSYNDSRMIGNYVYFATANYNYNYIDSEPVLPKILQNGEVLSNSCQSGSSINCFMPDVYYFDIPYESYNFTNITAININDPAENISGNTYIMSGSQNMYVSQNNIYITYTKYISEYELEMEVMRELIYPRLSAKDQEKINKIENIENYILSAQEKKDKISQIIARYGESLSTEEQSKIEEELQNKIKEKYKNLAEELEKTVIHKIAINKNKLEYKNYGEVTGQTLNQFSMDENNGFFRIATTKSQTWSQYDEVQSGSYNNLFVLDADMKIIGELKNLAAGEKIYSVRFMQNRAYMVTFKQTDPLFVIDLVDPKNPVVLGKLKIPGFSNYLHPYDSTTLIGIGKDTTENQWGGVQTKGIKLSLFDVSRVDEPKEINSYVLGDAGSDSIALTDHKAFLFSKDKNLLVIPVSINETLNTNQWGRLIFSGAAIFQVDKTGFSLKGKIDHSQGGQVAPVDYWNGYNYYDNTVKRSLYIEDTLYTFSNNYLKMNELKELKMLNNLQLIKEKKDNSDDYNVIN